MPLQPQDLCHTPTLILTLTRALPCVLQSQDPYSDPNLDPDPSLHPDRNLDPDPNLHPDAEQAAEVLASSTLALSQLAALADAEHRQNLLWCLGGHTAAVELLRVLANVEKQARLPPEAVKAMRESAFALLCAFCEGNKRNQALYLPYLSP